jgi:hypothetical protein
MVVKLKQVNLYSKKPELNILKEISKEVNNIPLPNIPDTPKILLPPPEHSLIRNNFQVYSEEILQNYNNPNRNEINPENKFEEEMELSKKHTMIGLKRRDHDDRPNIGLSKKKMKLSASHNNQEEMSKNIGLKSNMTIGNKYMTSKQNFNNINNNNLNNINNNNNNTGSNFQAKHKQSDPSVDGNYLEDDSMSNHHYNNTFIMNNDNNSEMDDYNYDMNFP